MRSRSETDSGKTSITDQSATSIELINLKISHVPLTERPLRIHSVAYHILSIDKGCFLIESC